MDILGCSEGWHSRGISWKNANHMWSVKSFR